MALGLGQLRLSSSNLWSMTPRELAAAVRGLSGQIGTPQPLTRAALAALSARFPD